MDFIFHEKQEGFLCAQHCLNALLQNNYFNAVDLATIANDLDATERQHLGTSANLGGESENMDDSGYFSIQVISKALEVWGLSLSPLPQDGAVAPANLDRYTAFICHFRQHWFTIRRLGRQWFNLNSMLSRPRLLTDTYVCLYLTQLQHEGYYIFLVEGQLPPCEADQALSENPAVSRQDSPSERDQAINWSASTTNYAVAARDEDDDDAMLKLALMESLKNNDAENPSLQRVLIDSGKAGFEEDLASAIMESLETAAPAETATESPGSAGAAQTAVSREDVRAKRQKFLDQFTAKEEHK